ncbi:MAG: hypothetical protein AAGD14_09360 [Planctomycetota bacterium]
MRSLFVALLGVAVCAAGSDPAPAHAYVLEIDGEKHEILEGRAYELEIDGKKRKVKLTPRGFLQVETPPFRFRYPRGFEYEHIEAKGAGDAPRWIVRGRTASATLTTSKEKTAEAAYTAKAREIAATIRKATEGRPAIKAGSLGASLAGHEVEGLRIENKTDPKMLTEDWVLAFRHKGKTWVIHMHGTATREQMLSTEFRMLMDLFLQYFELR